MPVLPERNYQTMGLDELLALIDADKLIAEWRAGLSVQRDLPLSAARTGCVTS